MPSDLVEKLEARVERLEHENDQLRARIKEGEENASIIPMDTLHTVRKNLLAAQELMDWLRAKPHRLATVNEKGHLLLIASPHRPILVHDMPGKIPGLHHDALVRSGTRLRDSWAREDSGLKEAFDTAVKALHDLI